MYAHIVPQSYLKQWRIAGSSNSIFVMYKQSFDQTWKIKNISRIAGLPNYYNLNIFDHQKNPKKDVRKFEGVNYRISTLITAFPDFFNNLYSDYLIKYEFLFDNRKLKTRYSYLNALIYFDNPNFTISINGNSICKSEIKIEINERWKKSGNLLYLEKQLCKIENDWSETMQKLLPIIDLTKDFMYEQSYGKLISFFVVQKARNAKSDFLKKIFTETIIKVNESVKVLKNLRKDLTDVKAEFSEDQYRNLILCALVNYFIGCEVSYVDAIKKDYKNIEIAVLKATGESNFITCDLPIVTYQDNKSISNHFDLLPISPKYCFFIYKPTIDNLLIVKKYNIIPIKDDVVKYINSKIYEWSKNEIYSCDIFFHYNESYKKFNINDIVSRHIEQ